MLKCNLTPSDLKRSCERLLVKIVSLFVTMTVGVGGMTPRYPQSTYTQGQVHKKSRKHNQDPGLLEQNCRLERTRPTHSQLRKANRTSRLKASRIHQPTSPYKRASPNSTGVSEQHSLSSVTATRHDDPAEAGLYHG